MLGSYRRDLRKGRNEWDGLAIAGVAGDPLTPRSDRLQVYMVALATRDRSLLFKEEDMRRPAGWKTTLNNKTHERLYFLSVLEPAETASLIILFAEMKLAIKDGRT